MKEQGVLPLPSAGMLVYHRVTQSILLCSPVPIYFDLGRERQYGVKFLVKGNNMTAETRV